ncbi:MAG: serine dehydratase subunit alpha family protein [Spirochaetales bacterium]|nr:serine dehydratase subunit alpha family protein [Spirochaetales bacterium]
MLIYKKCLDLLEKELIPALGCTEPIAIALAAAKARETLGTFPERVKISVSGNVLKNVKSVVVPNTGGLKGIDAACIIGIVSGKSEQKLEILREISPTELAKAQSLLASNFCSVQHLQSDASLHIIVEAFAGSDCSLVELKEDHSQIVRIERNNQVIFTKAQLDVANDEIALSIQDIFDFANSVKLEDVHDLIERQIQYNTAICIEGLDHNYGQNIGRTLIEIYGNDAKVRARALAAAGSDARMSGCGLPVIINSGSGNQGITVSIPITEFAKEFKSSDEQLIRALVLGNLIAIYMKRGIGKLSAYCGVVSASCGAGAGITYLAGGNLEKISKTITNTVANVSGIVCDGAKPSCAAKIASSVDACIIAHHMAMQDHAFGAGDGIVKDNIEKTIESVTRIGKDGMKETDAEILHIMFDDYQK